MDPTEQALKYAAAAGNAAGTKLNDGNLSFLASMLDISVDCVRKGKITPAGVADALIKAGLATPDLINSPDVKEKTIQCAADVGELGFALGSFAGAIVETSATSGLAAPSVYVTGAGLVSQVYSTTVSCEGAAVAISGAALKDVTKRFKAVSEVTKGLVAVCIQELNKNTEKHFKPENHAFTALPSVAQLQLKEFLDSIRVCLFFQKCELYLLITRKVPAATARQIAQGIILAKKYEFQRPPANALSQLNPQEIGRIANTYTNKSVGAAFNMLLSALNFS